MANPIDLSLGQKFEIERFSREIDGTTDIEALRAIAKQLLRAWQVQRAAAQWVIQEQFKRCGPTTR